MLAQWNLVKFRKITNSLNRNFRKLDNVALTSLTLREKLP